MIAKKETWDVKSIMMPEYTGLDPVVVTLQLM